MVRPNPGTLEIEWLDNLKPLAEAVGEQVLGHPIDWRVESGLTSSAERPDVVIEDRRTRVAVVSGEAKRPQLPEGLHPLIDAEVNGAIAKAQKLGVSLCFTTNFHQIALLEAGPGLANPVTRLCGDVIDFIPEVLAIQNNWWRDLDDESREQAARAGLQELFERIHRLRTGQSVSKRLDEIVIGFLTRITDELIEPLAQTFLSGPWSADPALKGQALAAGLKLTEKQDCRYLVSQGVVEVLSAALFYQVLRSYFSGLSELLGGTSPSTSASLCKAVKASFADAMAESGDYESILALTKIGEWVLKEAPQPAIQHWLALSAFVEQLDVSELTGDVLGTIFERLISPERRRAMGQHYTQPRLARSMAKWGVRDVCDRVMGPACGAGTFLVETRGRHVALGATHDDSLERTYGNDLDPFAAHLAAINLATRRIRRGANYPMIRQGDAFDLIPGTTMLSVHTAGGLDVTRQLDGVDLIITNPPFAERHPDEAGAVGKVTPLLAAQKRSLPTMRRGNLAAWFVLLAAGLAPDTRLAYVLPIPVWQNENLEEWRKWVRKYFDIVLWYTEEDIWFSDARQGVCVGLFEPRLPEDISSRPSGSLKFVSIGEPVSGELLSLNDVASPSTNAVISDLSECDAGADPIVEATRPQSLRGFESLPATSRLRDLKGCEVSSGQKLGHDFFKLRDVAPERKAAARDVIGLGVQFRIPAKFVTPLLSTPKELTTGEVGGADTCLLTLPKNKPTARQVLAYLKPPLASRWANPS